MLLLVIMLTQTGSGGLDASPLIKWPDGAPCKLTDARGNLVEVDPGVCRALVAYANPQVTARSTLLQYDVTASGALENCTVVETSGVPSLDAKACSTLVERAKYSGGPSKSKRIRITWSVKD